MQNLLFVKGDTLEKYILPAELKRYKDNQQYQGINSYVIGDFKITKTELPYVTVKIKHPKAMDEKRWSWAEELTFKVELYQGQLYIMPLGWDGNYINPWWTAKEIN